MAVVYSVAITSGIPSSGTGEVATINEFLSVPGTPNSTSVITIQPQGISRATVSATTGSNETLVKASAATLFGVHLYNNAQTGMYLKLYNLSSAPTIGTSTPIFTVGVSPGAARDVHLFGMPSSIGLGYTITAGITSTSTTGAAANDLVGLIEYI